MNYSHVPKINGKKLRRIFSIFFAIFTSFFVLIIGVSAKTVDVYNINDFFNFAKFRSYDDYNNFNENRWHYVNYFEPGSWSGAYEDTVSVGIIKDSEFNNLIVEDDKGVTALMLIGQPPIDTLKAGSLLRVEMEISFSVPISYFQPTQITFGINEFVNAPNPSLYETSLVDGSYVSTDGYENFYGDITEAWQADSVYLEFVCQPDVDIPYAEHYLQFIQSDGYGDYGYQFTNEFYCAFEKLSLHYEDDETEWIAALDSNTNKIINSLGSNSSFGDDHADLFDSLDVIEKDLMDSANDGLLSFSNLIRGLNVNDGATIRAVVYFANIFDTFINRISFSSVFNWLTVFGVFGILLSIGASLVGKFKDSSSGIKNYHGKKYKRK